MRSRIPTPSRSRILLLALGTWASACGANPEPSPRVGTQQARPLEITGPAAVVAPDPWQIKLRSRVPAESGLGVGSKLSAFDIVNSETGEQYCQVCKFGGVPKIMAIGGPDDREFHEDLQDLDAIAQKYGPERLRIFAVVTSIENGRSPTPIAEQDRARTTADTLRRRLRLAMPVAIPAPENNQPNRVWEEYYNVTRSRTIMLADGKNMVRWAAVAPNDFAELDTTLREILGPR